MCECDACALTLQFYLVSLFKLYIVETNGSMSKCRSSTCLHLNGFLIIRSLIVCCTTFHLMPKSQYMIQVLIFVWRLVMLVHPTLHRYWNSGTTEQLDSSCWLLQAVSPNMCWPNEWSGKQSTSNQLKIQGRHRGVIKLLYEYLNVHSLSIITPTLHCKKRINLQSLTINLTIPLRFTHMFSWSLFIFLSLFFNLDKCFKKSNGLRISGGKGTELEIRRSPVQAPLSLIYHCWAPKCNHVGSCHCSNNLETRETKEKIRKEWRYVP